MNEKLNGDTSDFRRLIKKTGGGVYLHGLRQDDDRHGSCVDALHPGGETDLRDPLHAMSSTFVLQMSVDVLAAYPHSRMVQTA